jgi:hypothetical protein
MEESCLRFILLRESMIVVITFFPTDLVSGLPPELLTLSLIKFVGDYPVEVRNLNVRSEKKAKLSYFAELVHHKYPRKFED